MAHVDKDEEHKIPPSFLREPPKITEVLARQMASESPPVAASTNVQTVKEKPPSVPEARAVDFAVKEQDVAVASSQEDAPSPAVDVIPPPLPALPGLPIEPASHNANPASHLWLPMGITALVVFNFSLIGLVLFLLVARPFSDDRQASPSASFVQTETVRATPPPERSPPQTTAREDLATPAGAPSARSASTAARLDVPRLLLTRGVSGFGQFDPLPGVRITPRRVAHITVYTEVLNPEAEPRLDERVIYNMTQRTRLYRTDVGPSEPLMDSTITLMVSGLSPRRDFHSAQPLRAARRIEPGEHTVEVRITDLVSGQTASNSTTFMVHPE